MSAIPLVAMFPVIRAPAPIGEGRILCTMMEPIDDVRPGYSPTYCKVWGVFYSDHGTTKPKPIQCTIPMSVWENRSNRLPFVQASPGDAWGPHAALIRTAKEATKHGT